MNLTSTTIASKPQQPDIAYTPDFDKYQARAARRLATEDLPKDLPAGFPKQLRGPLVWDGQSIIKDFQWTYSLNKDQLQEVDAALHHFLSLGLTTGHVSSETFPLPKLHPELRRLSNELHFGHGFFILRGIPVESYSRAENVILYAGLSAHIAPIRGRQDTSFQGKSAAVVLAHIKDLSTRPDASASIGSPAYTADRQVFHTDLGDIVSLFCLETAAQGGESQLASASRVYNELAVTRPDLIHTLAEDWDADRYGQTGYESRPLLYYQPATSETAERVLLQYARRSFVGFGALQRPKDIPPITEAQAEALDAIHYLGERFHVALDFQKGDIQYVNNLAIFHARRGFTDTDDHQRHLLRLWLRDPENAWVTPDQLKSKWANSYNDVTPESQSFPLEPYVRSQSKGVKSS